MSVELPTMAVAERAERVRPLLADAGCEALVVTNLTNVRYLTGFTGSNASVVVGEDWCRLFTDGRYRDQAPAELAAAGVDADVEIGVDVDDRVAAALDGIAAIGLEAESVTWRRQSSLAELCGGDLVATSGLVEQLRAIKDPGELARIEAAAGAVDRALAEVRSMLGDEPTERAFALELDGAAIARGTAGPAYETIVASGPNGARPHARPSDRRISSGDLVVVDVGGVVDGYRSDMTRTFVVGEPGRRQTALLELVIEAQAAGVSAVAAGSAASAVDDAARSVIDDAGHGEAFSHGTGHGVGLDIHESPWINARADTVLAEHHVCTVEPGVYLDGYGGVRIEDSVVVTATGARRLTNSPRSLQDLVVS